MNGWPHRNDAVVEWMKSWRDRFDEQYDDEFHVVDAMIDDYRLRADTGTRLDEEPPVDGGYETE